MTREQFEDARLAVEKANKLIQEIDFLNKRLEKVKAQIYTVDGVDFVGKDKDYIFMIHKAIGDTEYLTDDIYVEDGKKFFKAIEQILSDRIDVLNAELESLPPYHSKLDCLKSFFNFR